MANWLQKVSARVTDSAKKQNLPAVLKTGAVSMQQRMGVQGKRLPNAAIIYGVAASFLAVIGVYFLFTGRWFTGCLVLFLAACFFGFALHIVKYS